jgi:aminoglycoside phosphotransferase (APT) family kinase protein
MTDEIPADLLEIAEALVPGARLADARLTQGQHHHVVLLPGVAAVRISRSPWTTDALPHRVEKLRAIAAAGLPFAVPDVLTPVTTFGEHAAVAVSWIAGTALPEGVGDPRRIGELLRTLREFPVTPELRAALGAPRPAAEQPRWAGVLVDEVLPRLPADWQDEGRERVAEALALEPVEPAIVHGDLGGGNVHWTEDGKLAGVLDWDLVQLFDPAFDAALMAWHGWENIRDAVDADTCRRAGVWERTFGVAHVAAVLNGETPVFVERYVASIVRWLEANADWRLS